MTDLQKFRQVISGKDRAAVFKQQVTQVKRLPQKTRKEIFESAGVRGSIYMDRSFGSALKTRLGLSWCKYREYRRMMRDIGVKFEAETAERELQEEVRCSDILLSEKKFEVPKDDAGSVGHGVHPMVHIRNVEEFVINLLNQYHR